MRPSVASILVGIVLMTSGLAVACGSAASNKQEKPAQDKATIEAPDQQGTTALMRAVEDRNDGEARRLIDSGANVNAKAQSGVTVLMKAAGVGDKEIVD